MECTKKIQKVECDNIECDFFFGALEAVGVEEIPRPIIEEGYKRIRKGAKFGGNYGGCSETCGEHCKQTSGGENNEVVNKERTSWNTLCFTYASLMLHL